MRKLIVILLVICLLLSLPACSKGSSTGSYGVKTLQTLVEQEYFLAFRNNDPLYFYITAAIETLAGEGYVQQLTAKCV